MRPQLEARASALRKAGAAVVDFPGWIAAAPRDALLARARLLALPSRWPEPFGLVGLEAARFGVPTVAFDLGGIGTWLTSGQNGVLVPAPAAAAGLGEAIGSLLRDVPLYRSLSKGATAAAATFSTAAHLSALERVLSSCRRPGTC